MFLFVLYFIINMVIFYYSQFLLLDKRHLPSSKGYIFNKYRFRNYSLCSCRVIRVLNTKYQFPFNQLTTLEFLPHISPNNMLILYK